MLVGCLDRSRKIFSLVIVIMYLNINKANGKIFPLAKEVVLPRSSKSEVPDEALEHGGVLLRQGHISPAHRPLGSYRVLLLFVLVPLLVLGPLSLGRRVEGFPIPLLPLPLIDVCLGLD